MVLVVGTLLDIRSVNKFVECFLYMTLEFREVGIKGWEHDLSDVISSRREPFYILHKEECFQHLQCHIVTQCTFCLLDIGLHLGLENTSDALVHVAELHNLVKVFILISLGYLLCDGQK